MPESTRVQVLEIPLPEFSHLPLTKAPARSDGWRFLRIRARLTPAGICLLLTLVLAPFAYAQDPGSPETGTNPTGTRPPAASVQRVATQPAALLDGTIDPTTYILGPGDELDLEVLGRISLSQVLVVDPEGQIWLRDLGRLAVGGLTLEQARDRIRRAFQGGTRGLEVHVLLQRMRVFKCFVSGEVTKPEAIEATAATRAAEAILGAGGLREGASKRNIVVRSRTGSIRHVDLLRFERLGDWLANPTLLDGDHVIVPPKGPPIFVYAPVDYPGEYEYREGDSLSVLLRMAGRFRPQAVLEQAVLLRFVGDTRVDTLAIDLGAVLAGRSDIALQEGDRVFVPARGEYHPDRHVTVTGEVVRPGVYPLNEGTDRISSAILLAGGTTPRASRHAVLVIRPGALALDRDLEWTRLSRLSRAEMTESEYQIFRTKLASAQAISVVDLESLQSAAGRDIAEGDDRDVQLKSGDVIVVERSELSIRVEGDVRHPGLVEYREGLRGIDYIEAAGGFSSRAKRSGARITRATTGQTMLLSDAPTVQTGDLIFVPDKSESHLATTIRDLVVFFAAVATVVIAFRK